MKKIYPLPLLLILFSLFNKDIKGATYIVTSNMNGTAVDGVSLRWAITQANSNAGADTITFNIAGIPPFVISLTSALPSLTDNSGVVIDGTTQPNNGFNGVSPKIILDDNNTTNGVAIDIQGQNSEIYGLYFRNFGINGFAVNAGNTGNANGSNFIIGAPGKGNVMNTGTSNSTGINVSSGINGGTIQSNKIGTDTTGTVATKLDIGIELDGTNVLVGGTVSGEGNLISGNGTNIHIVGSYNSIYGNILGADINGNYLSSLSSNGIYIFTGSGHNNIGGSLPGEGNIIAYNFLTTSTGGGLEIQSSNNNLISRNSIYCNGGWGGIELIGGNNSYPSPVIVSSSTTGATGTSPGKATVELFYNHSGCTPTATVGCQGEIYIGTTTADASGNWTYTGSLIAGKSLVATATDSVNNTSAFSNCNVSVVLGPTASFESSDTSFCANNCINFTNLSANATSWAWTFPGGTPSSSTAQNPSNICFHTSGGYTVKLVVSNSGAKDSTTLAITVNALPVINVSPSSPSVCNGQSISVTASGASTYVWAPSTGITGTTGTVSANPTSTTTYTITGTDANGCTNTQSVTLTVNPLPVITANPLSPSICNGQSVSVTAGGASSFVWAPSTGLSGTSGPTVSANPLSTTTYTITGTDINGCSNTSSVTVTVNSPPVITVNPSALILCNGQSVLLTAGGGTTYIWSPLTGLSGTTGTTVSANPSSTTTYTLSGTDANGCTNTKSVTVTVNPLPVIAVSPSSSAICNGESVSVTASGANTYVWAPSTGISGTTGTVSANPSSTTTYTITGTDANGCTNTKSVTVTVNPLPVITANPPSPSICNGQSISVTAAGAISYIWAPSNGLSGTSGTTVSANPSSTTTYTITGTDINGCSNTSSVTVTVNPSPVITVNPSAPILCNGQSVLLTAGGGTTYIWSPLTGLSGTTGTTVSANPSSTATYSITGTDDNGCTNTKSVTITVNPVPVITASPSSPAVCNGQPVSLTAGGGNTYVWAPSTGLSGTSGTTVSANPSSTTTYTITGTDANGCTNTKSVTVTVNPLPVITFSPSSPSICNGQPALVTANGASTYVWSPSTGLSGTSGTTVSANPASTITYIITGTDINGCSNTSSLTVTVNSLPIISVNPSAPVLCMGDSISLTATGATDYIWSPSAGLSASTGTVVSANPTSTSTYTITGTDLNGCDNTSSVTVTVNALPVISISPNSPTICNGDSVSLIASGGNTYIWTPVTGLSSGSATIVSAIPASTTTYSVTGTDGNSCSNMATVKITVNPLPAITIDPTDSAVCGGQSVQLTASGGISYIWNPTTGLSSESGSVVSANPDTTTTYYATGTDGNGCTNTSSVSLTINPLPVVNAGPDVTICPNDSSPLIVTGPPFGSTYIWSPSTNLSCSNCPNPYAFPLVSATYIVSATTPAGCSAQDTVIVNVTPLFASVTPHDTTICYGNVVQLLASGGSNYSWSPPTGLSDTTIDTPLAFTLLTTTYTVTVSSGSCSSTATTIINVLDSLPTPNITQSADTLYCTTNPVYTAYQWHFNSNLIPNATNSYYVATQDGNYNVVVFDENGCSISVGINIVLNVGLLPFSPVTAGFAISPNPAGDELNISANGQPENAVLTIYNIVGEKMLEEKIKNTNYIMINIQNLSAGIYFVQLSDKSGSMKKKFVKE